MSYHLATHVSWLILLYITKALLQSGSAIFLYACEFVCSLTGALLMCGCHTFLRSYLACQLLMILLPLPPLSPWECWDYRWVALHPTFYVGSRAWTQVIMCLCSMCLYLARKTHEGHYLSGFALGCLAYGKYPDHVHEWTKSTKYHCTLL